ncbi:MAG TPA: class II aldolase/adducin family protein [Smithellaceae bacterium]|nr:class II aldolase/adducin family protein [Smithellaceae bacterium]HRS83193.1 class II aldolase/adducin family protein [Smithellaceae bacterium]HRV45035.1 class II aldolase/adducin family protein [Smithellaceae bacterium]
MGLYDSYQKDVLEASLWLSEHGYFGSLRGTGGNVSARIAGRDLMAITPSSVKYSDLAPSDICIVDFAGAVVEGKYPPSIEAGMHAAIYRERPDVNAVVHTHQLYGSVFAALGRPIPVLFDEVAFALGESVEVAPYALSGSAELASNVAGLLANHANAYLIQNHGILALGKNMDKALLAAELLEKIAHIYCLALSTGKPVTLLPDATRETARSLRDFEVETARKKP